MSSAADRCKTACPRTRGLPTAICHHGALDYLMAVKPFCADSYIAKSSLTRLPRKSLSFACGQNIGTTQSTEKGRRFVKPSLDGDWLVFLASLRR